MGERKKEEEAAVKGTGKPEKGSGDTIAQDEKGNEHMSGYFISKRSVWLAAGGALGALAAIGIGKVSQKVRPAVVGAVKEGYAFKEWAASKIERVREDAEDIVAEAKHAYHKDIETTAEAVRREKEILEKTEKAVEKKRARKKEAK